MSKSLDSDQLSELVECLHFVEDPRVKGRSKHLLIDILVLSVFAIICGAEGVTEISAYGEEKEEWLGQFLELPAGMPSHDTIARVLSIIDPLQLEAAFSHWVQEALVGRTKINRISLDGKSSKGTQRGFNVKKRPLHIVSAYSHELGLTLMQSESQSSGQAESEAAVECLKMLDLKDVTVLADAGLTAKKIINQIVGQQGNYMVSVKANHRTSMQELASAFSGNMKTTQAQTLDQAHGREEIRTCRIMPANQMSERFLESWPEVKTVFEMTRERTEKDKRYHIKTTHPDTKVTYEKNESGIKETKEVTYYVTSLKLTASQAIKEVRKHWLIENEVHWILDVAFSEDSWTVRSKKLARSLSLVRRIALNIIRTSKTQGSVKARMKKAGWNNEFLERIVFGD